MLSVIRIFDESLLFFSPNITDIFLNADKLIKLSGFEFIISQKANCTINKRETKNGPIFRGTWGHRIVSLLNQTQRIIWNINVATTEQIKEKQKKIVGPEM